MECNIPESDVRVNDDSTNENRVEDGVKRASRKGSNSKWDESSGNQAA